MAPRGQQQQRQTPDSAGEEAFLASAMAATEQEIFLEAMGDEEPENDGDTSAEQMEDIEGGAVDDVGDEVEGAEDDGDEDGAGDEVGGDGDQRANQDDQRGGDRGRQTQDRSGDWQEPAGPRVPSWRAPGAADPRDAHIASLEARLQRIESAPRAGQTERTEAAELPDPVIDPVGFREAIRKEFRDSTEQQVTSRVLASNFAMTHSAYDEAGRGDEFEYAAGELNQMALAAARNPALAQTVRSIVTARDPGRALMQWAEKELDLDSFRAESQGNRLEQAARLLGVDVADLEGFAPQPAQGRERSRERQDSRQQEQRGQERRPAQQQQRGRRLPSLNSAGGAGREGGNSRNLDPRGFDGSEGAIFDFAMT